MYINIGKYSESSLLFPDTKLLLPLINKLHFLLSETIFLMNNLFGLQFLWTLVDVLDFFIYDWAYGILIRYKALGDSRLPNAFMEDVLAIPCRSLSTMKFVIIVWMCSDMTNQVIVNSLR